MIDTHAHAHFNAYKDDMDEVIERSLARGAVINLVGTQADTSKRAVEVAEKYDGVYATIGLHPEHLFSKWVDEEETSFQSREESFDYEYYKSLAVMPKVIGIGECGLDFYRIPEGMTKEAMLPKQAEVFRQHINLSQETNLPLIIHCREAHEEMIAILNTFVSLSVNSAERGEGPPQKQGDYSVVPSNSGLPQNDNANKKLRGTMHCYTSSWINAQKYLEMGFYIGFTGVITFPPQKANPQAQADLLEVVRKMPEDRILLETDCPYLSPIPYRGKRGEPWMIEATAAKIAELRGISLEETLSVTTKNARNLFQKMV